METKLISIYDLIKNGWHLYIKNIKKMLLPIGITIPPYILLYALEYFTFPGQPIIMLVIAILAVFVALWASVIFIEMIDKISKNQSYDQNEIFKSSMKKIASYFWVIILVALIIIGGFILLIIPGIIFAVWYAFAEYIVVLEEKDNKGIKALASSKDLVRGRWGAAFWRLCLPTLLVYLTGTLITLAIAYILTLGKMDFTALDQNIVFNIIFSFIFLCLSPLFTAYGVIAYNNFKATKSIIIQ